MKIMKSARTQRKVTTVSPSQTKPPSNYHHHSPKNRQKTTEGRRGEERGVQTDPEGRKKQECKRKKLVRKQQREGR